MRTTILRISRTGIRSRGPYWTPISLAVWHGNVPAVRALLKSGVDVNKRVSTRTRGPHCSTQP